MADRIVLPRIGTVAAWRTEARRAAARGMRPDDVTWSVGEAVPDLFAGAVTRPLRPGVPLRLTREALEGLETAMLHGDPARFALGYAAVLRLSRHEAVWDDRTDPAMRRLAEMAKAVRRDIHKMHAFVRFRELPAEGARRRFGAWFEPAHPITEAAAPFFARRFGDMDWVIATPHLTARFADGVLAFAETVDAAPPAADATEGLWQTYYANIFNPARLKVQAMRSEMPRKYWRNLPEADLIPGMIRNAPARVLAMQAAEGTPPAPSILRRAAAARARVVPAAGAALPQTLEEARNAASACTRCPLHGPATQTVWGEGPRDAALMIVGEQPGDREDLAGRAFVGPAGAVLEAAMQAAGVDRARVYLTNAVKHFKFAPRGRRRIHQRPDAGEVTACRWWLEMERGMIRPDLIVALGATAALALTGRAQAIGAEPGRVVALDDGTPVLISVHPAHILRVPDPQAAEAARARLAADLALARRIVEDRRQAA